MNVSCCISADGAVARNEALRRPGPAVAFHMKAWKHPFLRDFFPRKDVYFADFNLNERRFRQKVLPLLSANEKPVVFVWGNNLPNFASNAIDQLDLKVFFIEDGFIRSSDAHASYSVPFSLSIDGRRPYFDSRGRSDLEDLLLCYPFESDRALNARAMRGIEAMLESRLTKYNGRRRSDERIWESSTSKKRVLVVGQVEEDASIRFGCETPFTNNDLVRLAARENPCASIFYKPHPDVLNKIRRQVSDPADVSHLCTILNGHVSLPDALDHTDHVYTITSLAGFEALVRGKTVTVLGGPFYAGWGLTDDRQPIPRRYRRLKVEDVFAAAYILYPSYFHIDGTVSTFEQTLARAAAGAISPSSAAPSGIRWELFGTYGFLGWRHLLTPLLAKIIAKMGNERHSAQFKRNPAGFFRELDEPGYRLIGRLLYPWGA